MLDSAAGVLARIRSGQVMSRWHWLQWNFTPGTEGETHFAPMVAWRLARCERKLPGYAERMIGRLEQVGGREKDMSDYESIVAWLAELLVTHHVVSWAWPAGTTFRDEPTAAGSGKNPELDVRLPDGLTLGVEVKCPALRAFSRDRSARDFQLNARFLDDKGGSLPGTVTPPRDNPVKDFLVSADGKFRSFKAEDPLYQSLLVIVWDDHINEPLAALTNQSSGLLTPKSFHRSGGTAVTYPALDAVVITRHQMQLVRGMANLPTVDDRHDFLDYGRRDGFPPHVYLPVATASGLDERFVDMTQAWPLEALLTAGAEYGGGEMVMWVDGGSGG